MQLCTAVSSVRVGGSGKEGREVVHRPIIEDSIVKLEEDKEFSL
jgi:hypothetical protein